MKELHLDNETFVFCEKHSQLAEFATNNDCRIPSWSGSGWYRYYRIDAGFLDENIVGVIDYIPEDLIRDMYGKAVDRLYKLEHKINQYKIMMLYKGDTDEKRS